MARARRTGLQIGEAEKTSAKQRQGRGPDVDLRSKTESDKLMALRQAVADAHAHRGVKIRKGTLKDIKDQFFGP